METKRKLALSGVIAIAVVAAILFVPSMLAQPPYSADSVYFLPEDSTGAYCQNNTIVQINVNTTVATTGVQMDIHFGPCVNITAVDFTGSAWPPLAPPGWAHYGNYVRISGTDLMGQSAGDWKFANITLHCLNGTDYCSSNLNFTNVVIVDNAAIPMPIPNVALHNGTISCTPEIKPNLKVDSVDPQYIFVNLTNVLSADITNNGNDASGPFVVAINITNNCTSSEVYNNATSVTDLGPGASTTVDLGNWKPTLVENITINVTADYNNDVTDEKDRSDNSQEVVRTTSCACSEYTGTPACANCSADTMLPDTCYGYRGQHPLDLAYEGGSGVMYLTGDYKYKNNTVNFNIGPGGDKDLIGDATADLTGKTVKTATLYVYYTWYKLAANGPPDWGMTFNTNPVSHDMNYMDTKGFTTSYDKYAYGTFVYNVTAYVTGNGAYTATRTNLTSGYTSGMALMVIYDDNSSSNMKYKIAHGYDRVASIYSNQYHVLPEDATTTATFLNVDPSMVVTAKLFTATVDGVHSSSGVSTYESQKFNACPWDQGTWSNEGLGTGGSYPIGVVRSDVTACLKNPAQTAYFQERDGSYFNGFGAVFACLQTQEGLPIISVEPEHTIVQPQEQFDIDINVTPNGAPVYAVEYYLHYNSDYFYAETQNKGPFLGEYGETVVSQNVIDNPNGVLHYAETRTVPGGVINANTLATVHFTAIGPRGAKSDLNLTGVIIINNATIEPYGAIMVNNGTLEISSNIPPTPMGLSKHQINNVAKKYPCNTIICSCSYDMNYPDKGGNITYIRWDFGDGQYGTSEGLPDENNCTCKNHTYDSWQWAPFGDPSGDYVDFTVHLTVTDDGCPEETSTDDFPVTVYIAGDANGDGSVNIMDAAFVGMHWNECCCDSGSCTCYPEPCNASVSGCMENLWDDLQQDRADLNNDCNINVLDAMITGANWGYTAWQ